MTNLDELNADLVTHEARLLELQDPKFGKKKTRKGGTSMNSYINAPLLIPSYNKIIKSIKEEIAEIEGKKKKKKKK